MLLCALVLPSQPLNDPHEPEKEKRPVSEQHGSDKRILQKLATLYLNPHAVSIVASPRFAYSQKAHTSGVQKNRALYRLCTLESSFCASYGFYALLESEA